MTTLLIFAINKTKDEKILVDIVRLLLGFGASVDMIDEYDRTALSAASFQEYIEIVKLLLESGAFIDLQNEEGWTALMSASEWGHTEIVKLLLEYGASVDLRGECEFARYSPLMLATYEGHVEIVKLLLESGASVDIEDDECDMSALDIAYNMEHDEIIQLLENET